MANLQKRGDYTPRRAREQRAFRLIQAGSVTGGGALVTLVLAIAGVTSLFLPILLIIVTAVIAWRFMVVTGQR